METRKVFVACSLGGFIGALVALQMRQPFWWIGLIVGALVGYLAYDFKEVIEAIPVAWRKATSKRARVRWRALGRSWVGYAAIGSNFFPFFWFAFSLIWGQMAVAFVASGLLTFLIFPAMLAPKEALEIRAYPYVYRARKQHALWLYGHYLPPLIIKGLCQISMIVAEVLVIVAEVPAAAAEGWRAARSFLWHLFLLIHSDFRLLCAFDAAWGAAIGYFFGSAVIGALAGGLIGIANYEILSKRVLHLVPTR